MTSPKFALNGVLSPMRKVGEINDHTDVLRLGFGRGAAAFARHVTRWPERLLARLALPGIGAAESCDFVVLRYWSVSQPAPGDADQLRRAEQRDRAHRRARPGQRGARLGGRSAERGPGDGAPRKSRRDAPY